MADLILQPTRNPDFFQYSPHGSVVRPLGRGIGRAGLTTPPGSPTPFQRPLQLDSSLCMQGISSSNEACHSLRAPSVGYRTDTRSKGGIVRTCFTETQRAKAHTMSLQETPFRAGRRASKFSPANIERIKEFVAQGVNRKKIAERLGVTVGSLQVTCSRLGISLRKPNGCSYSRMSRPVPLGSSADGKHIGMASATPPKFEIVLHYRGATQTAILPLTSSDIARLALEASVQSSSMLRVISQAVAGAIKRNMIQQGYA